jgi:hypothetical protein
MIPSIKGVKGLESVAPNNRSITEEVLNKKEVIILFIS